MGIWESDILKNSEIDKENRLSKEEGGTPIDNYFFQGDNLHLKREDKNPTGSQKDRGLAYQISAHIQDGKDEFVISSSGNSAISALNLIKGRKEILTIFLSPKISLDKFKRMQKHLGAYIIFGETTEVGNITIRFSKRAVSDAFKESKESGAVLLRGSQDSYAHQGYMTISEEIISELPDCTDIFIPSSSGTTTAGIYLGYEELTNVSNKPLPRLHICQTTFINTLIRDVVGEFKPSKSSIATSIVDRVGHRRKEITEIIEKTDGYGWVMDDKEIENAYKTLALDKINLSYETAVAVSAYLRAANENIKMETPLILATGMRESI